MNSGEMLLFALSTGANPAVMGGTKGGKVLIMANQEADARSLAH